MVPGGLGQRLVKSGRAEVRRLGVLGYHGLFGTLAQVSDGAWSCRSRDGWVTLLFGQASLLSKLLLLMFDEALSLLHR